MPDLRLPLTIRPAPGGFAIVFADGGQHIYIEGHDAPAGALLEGAMTSEQALDLAKEVASALVAAWSDPHEAFEAGRREGRRDATEEYKAKIAAVWDQEPKENESSGGPPAAVRKLEQHQECERPQAKRSFADDLRTAIGQ